MDEIVDCGSTGVHPHCVIYQWLELLQLLRKSVVKSQGHRLGSVTIVTSRLERSLEVEKLVRNAAIVVGSGPNGLAAAIVLARAGFDVEVREAADLPGGGARTAELTLPGFHHDVCSAVHPLAIASPFFSTLGLHAHGLSWIWSPAALAHPLDDGSAVLLHRDIRTTAAQFGSDAAGWRRLFEPVVRDWKLLMEDVLRAPIHIPRHPLALARFGVRAVQPATLVARTMFRGERAKALWAGVAAHSILKLEAPLSAAFGFILGGSAHAVGWPIPEGGAQKITNALIGVLTSLGGRLVTGRRVGHLDELEGADLKLLDVTPRQLIELGRGRLPSVFADNLRRFRYGPGVFKVDWALREPIPWRARECNQAITVHLGGTLGEIAASERAAWEGRPPEKPFVLLAQPTLFDQTRAPQGRHIAWAYCHVPNGWTAPVLEQIERQVERFAPGFRDCVLARSTHNPAEMQALNHNLVGGDINCGAPTISQFLFRPTARTYGTPLPGVYLCSSSTPPGGGVHGMCGYNAARLALRGVS